MPDDKVTKSSGACVVVARMNPAILQPSWLVAQGIFPDAEVEWAFALAPAFTGTQFKFQGLRWACTPERLTVTTEDLDKSPGRPVSEVFQKLGHTPVGSSGNNCRFDLAEDAGKALFDRVKSPLDEAVFSGERKNLGREMKFKVGHPNEALLNLFFECDDVRVTAVRFNFHRVVATAEQAATAAARWSDDVADAKALLAEVLGA